MPADRIFGILYRALKPVKYNESEINAVKMKMIIKDLIETP